MSARDPTQRFSNTVQYYVKYRPDYPKSVLDLLKELGLPANAVVADMGSGTGIFTKRLLEQGYHVIAIEPNDEMREYAENELSNYANFTSVNAPAESTGLRTHSVDCITAATAFHWFDPKKAHLEFKRILKPHCYCVLLWNVRDKESSPFMCDYEKLLEKYMNDYVAERITQHHIIEFFKPQEVTIVEFPNVQVFNEEELLGRVLSSSYSPKPGEPRYPAMVEAIKALFVKHQRNGKVHFTYRTKCYYGYL